MGITLNPSTLLSGSGLDVSTLVQQILAKRSGPISVWQNEQTTLATQQGLLLGINNNLTNLANAVQALSDPVGALSTLSASSSQPNILTASAQNSAAAGVHEIVVSNLATTGAVFTDPLSNGTADSSILTDPGQSGNISLQIGGADGTTHNITITAGSNDTLNTLADYINGQSWGVTASVVTDANGPRLILTSQSTGSVGALAITDNTNTILNFNPPTGGGNASITVDGVPFSSTTNTVTGAIPGVTLNLKSADPNTTAQLTVGIDPTQVTQAVSNFVSAYNAIIANINQQYTVDPTTNNEGPLGSDFSLRSLQSSLLNDVSYAITGNDGVVNLAALGISSNNDGTLSINTTATADGPAFADVLANNPGAVQSFFQNASQTGFAQNFHNDLNNLTSPVTGILNAEIAQNGTQQQTLTNSINNLETQLLAEQQQLTTQYSKVNASLQSYPLLLQAVTEVIGSLSTSSSAGQSSTPTLTQGL